LLFAVLPAGPMALGLALQSNLAVELGMDNTQVGWLNLYSTIVSAAGCVAGGLLSDRLGRKRMLALYVAGMAPATIYLMMALQRHGWIMPVDPQMLNRPHVPALITALWIATMSYSLFNGLMYGTRTALFMDVTTPAVAATQFTAYMALLNMAISYSATWQGVAVEAIGYPRTLLVDTVFGLASLALLPLMKRAAAREPSAAAASALMRARSMAAALGALMFLWLVNRHLSGGAGRLQPLVDTFFTIVFVVAGMFQIGSVAVIAGRALRRLSLLTGVLTLLMHAFRFYSESIGGWVGFDPDGPWKSLAGAYLDIVPALVGLFLFALAASRGLSVVLPEADETAAVPEAAV